MSVTNASSTLTLLMTIHEFMTRRVGRRAVPVVLEHVRLHASMPNDVIGNRAGSGAAHQGQVPLRVVAGVLGGLDRSGNQPPEVHVELHGLCQTWVFGSCWCSPTGAGYLGAG